MMRLLHLFPFLILLANVLAAPKLLGAVLLPRVYTSFCQQAPCPPSYPGQYQPYRPPSCPILDKPLPSLPEAAAHQSIPWDPPAYIDNICGTASQPVKQYLSPGFWRAHPAAASPNGEIPQEMENPPLPLSIWYPKPPFVMGHCVSFP